GRRQHLDAPPPHTKAEGQKNGRHLRQVLEVRPRIELERGESCNRGRAEESRIGASPKRPDRRPDSERHESEGRHLGCQAGSRGPVYPSGAPRPRPSHASPRTGGASTQAEIVRPVSATRRTEPSPTRPSTALPAGPASRRSPARTATLAAAAANSRPLFTFMAN